MSSNRFEALKARLEQPASADDEQGLVMVRLPRKAAEIAKRLRKPAVGKGGKANGRLEPLGETVAEMIYAVAEMLEERAGKTPGK